MFHVKHGWAVLGTSRRLVSEQRLSPIRSLPDWTLKGFRRAAIPYPRYEGQCTVSREHNFPSSRPRRRQSSIRRLSRHSSTDESDGPGSESPVTPASGQTARSRVFHVKRRRRRRRCRATTTWVSVRRLCRLLDHRQAGRAFLAGLDTAAVPPTRPPSSRVRVPSWSRYGGGAAYSTIGRWGRGFLLVSVRRLCRLLDHRSGTVIRARATPGKGTAG